MRATDMRFAESVRRYLASLLVHDVLDDWHDDVYSADCGEEKKLPGGKVVRPIRRLYFNSMKIFRGPSLDEMAGRLVSSTRDLVTAHADEWVRVRAGAVVLNGRALLLPSPPSPHLSALTGLLVAHGGGYLGDELIRIDPVLGNVHGLPFPLLVDSDDLGCFPQLEREPGGRRPPRPPEIVQARTPRRAVSPAEIGGSYAEQAVPGRIVFPTFAFGEPTELVPLAAAEALFRFGEAVLNMHVWADRALVVLRRIMESVPVERLIVGSLPDAAELLLATTPAGRRG